MDYIELACPRSLESLNRAQVIWIPAILPLELTYLSEVGRLSPDGGYEKVKTFLTTSLGARFTETPAHPLTRIAQRLAWTRDPFDRLICAEALCLRSPLVSTDRLVHQHMPAGAVLR